jgi:hypothetical protein
VKAKRIQVTVTKEDIKTGEQDSSCNCPIANALKRRKDCASTDENDYENPPRVWHSHVRFNRREFNHTDASLKFIHRFDAGKTVRPTTFRFTEVR